MARVETSDPTQQVAAAARAEEESVRPQEGVQGPVAEGEHVHSVEGFRIPAAVRKREPERVARHGMAGGHGELRVEVVEGPTHQVCVGSRSRMCHGPAMREGEMPWGAYGLRIALAGVFVALVLLLACRTPEAIPLPQEPLRPFLQRAAEARGRPFLRPVRASLLSPDRVAERLEREMRRLLEPDVFAAHTALLTDVGLLPRETDLWAELRALQGEAVAGYYAPLDDGLYVVAPDPEALNRSLADPTTAQILVHELGHALQAQHARLMEIGIGLLEPDDLAFALSALLEGDALFTEMRDAELQHGVPRPDAAAYAHRFETDVQRGLPEISPWLSAMFLTPYPAGYAWVSTRHAEAGLAGLDEAWADPPLSSAAVLDPSRPRRGRREVRAPDLSSFGCRETVSNAYGVVGLGLWLGLSAPARLEFPWRSDRAWALACETGEGWAWLVEFETPEDLERWIGAFRERAQHSDPPASVERGVSSLLVSRGVSAELVAHLLAASRFDDHPNLDAWVEAHPEVLARSRRLRAALDARDAALAPTVGYPRR